MRFVNNPGKLLSLSETELAVQKCYPFTSLQTYNNFKIQGSHCALFHF